MPFLIKEGMVWPPMDLLSWKMAEHSAWYSGDPERIADYYSRMIDKNLQSMPYPIRTSESFWGRQYRNTGDCFVHVPIASDISETCANILFGESPIVEVAQAHERTTSASYKAAQDGLDLMLMESGFFRKILEGAETGSAIGGTYIKVAWDDELSPYPIPVVQQADSALPTFSFGILKDVTFWKVLPAVDDHRNVYRLFELYEKGSIKYSLYKGTDDKVGMMVDLGSHPETEGMQEVVDTFGELLVVYVPNVLPNRIDRNSYIGRSDYHGIEGMMDSLDEVYSSWLKDIVLAQGKIHIPEAFLSKDGEGKKSFNVDRMMYVKLDMDPTIENKPITATQFDIRAEQFEKSAMAFLERIITSAGYSPQSFGLNIEGKAESGTALNIRERKTYATKVKKEQYWQLALKQLVQKMILVYNKVLDGGIEGDIEVDVAFSDSSGNGLNEVATAVKMIADAQAASVDTKVRMLHPDWEEEQILAEVKAIIDENGIGMVVPAPDGNPDLNQMDEDDKDEE